MAVPAAPSISTWPKVGWRVPRGRQVTRTSERGGAGSGRTSIPSTRGALFMRLRRQTMTGGELPAWTMPAKGAWRDCASSRLTPWLWSQKGDSSTWATRPAAVRCRLSSKSWP